MSSYKRIQLVQSLYKYTVSWFAQLRLDQARNIMCNDEHMDSVDVNNDVSIIGHALEGSNRERRLRVATWNFFGKQKEIGEMAL